MVTAGSGTCLTALLPFVGMLMCILLLCFMGSYSLLILELKDTFGASQFSLGWVMAFYFIGGCISAAASPSLFGRYGYRPVCLCASVVCVSGSILCSVTPNVYWLYLFYGVLVGGAIVTIDVAMTTLIQRNVPDKNIAFAFAVTTTGYAIGDFLWPIVYKVLVDEYGWRGAFLIQGGLVSNLAVLMLVLTAMVKSTDENRGTNYKSTIDDVVDTTNNLVSEDTTTSAKKDEADVKSDDVTTRSDGGFCGVRIFDVIIFLVFFLYASAESFLKLFMGVRMDRLGLSKTQIVTIMSVSGLVGLSRPLPSVLIDRCQFDKLKVAALFIFLIGVVAMVSVLFTSFPALLAYFTFWGFMQSVVFPLMSPVFALVYGSHRTETAMGAKSFAFSAAVVISMPLSGLLLDVLEISIPIVLFGGLYVLAVPLIVSIVVFKK